MQDRKMIKKAPAAVKTIPRSRLTENDECSYGYSVATKLNNTIDWEDFIVRKILNKHLLQILNA